MADPVRLMHYDPRWRQEFQQTRSTVLQSCGGRVGAVEHVGSTALPGLIAQPVIDLVAGLAAGQRLSTAQRALEGINFRPQPLPPWLESHAADDPSAAVALLHRPRHGPPTHTLVLTAIDSPAWRRLLAVRQWLEADRARAIDFEAAKLHHWQSGEGDPDAYAEAKAHLFAAIEAAAA